MRLLTGGCLATCDPDLSRSLWPPETMLSQPSELMRPSQLVPGGDRLDEPLAGDERVALAKLEGVVSADFFTMFPLVEL